MYTHIFLAAVVALTAVFVGGRAWSKFSDLPILPRLGKSLIHLIGLQILLGIVALVVVILRGTAEEIPFWEVTVTSVHQATGALILMFATLMMVWSYRLIAPPSQAAAN
jgi:cytochrome b561